MADVQYKISADEKQAAAAWERLAQKQNSLDKSLERVNNQLRKQGQRQLESTNTTNKMVGSLGRMAAGYLSARTAIQAFSEGIASIQQAGQAMSDFEKEITPLLSLGDNIQNIGKFKAEVIGLSNAFDRPRAEVAAFLYDLQSGTANLTPEIRDGLKKESLELAKALGVDLATSLKGMVKTYQIYGDQVADVNDLQNKLINATNQGYMTFDDLGTLLPDVSAAARAMGNSLDQVLGTLITATQYGGKNEKTFTGVRNVFLRMQDAEEKGFKITGSFLDQMRQLAGLEGTDLGKIFGAEAIAVAKNLSEHVAELQLNIEGSANAAGDLAGKINLLRLTDVNSAIAQFTDVTKRGVENAVPGKGMSGAAAGASLDWTMAQRGFRETMPEFMQGGMIEKGYLAASMLGDPFGFRKKGAQSTQADLYNSGQILESWAFAREMGLDKNAPQYGTTAGMFGPNNMDRGGPAPTFNSDVAAQLKPLLERIADNTDKASAQPDMAVAEAPKATSPATGQSINRDAGVTE